MNHASDITYASPLPAGQERVRAGRAQPQAAPREPMTITQAFDSELEFRNLLSTLSLPDTAVNRLIADEGIINARELANQKPNNLSTSLESVNRISATNARQAERAYFSTALIQKLKALCAYFRRCITSNSIPDIRLITPREVDNFIQYIDSWTRKAGNVQDHISSNSDIKFDQNNFTKFRQKIETLTAGLIGERSISIKYLLRSNDVALAEPVEDPIPDVYSIEFMMNNTSLNGNDYDSDNHTLFTILRHYLTNTPGWNVIAKFAREEDGRAAFKALRKHYEGASYHEAMKTRANAMMMRTFYRGGPSKFTWEKFIGIHLEAHRMFDDIGEPLTDSLKILYLKGGIRPESGLESSMEVAKGLPHTRNNFEEYVNHLTESVSNKRSRAETFKSADSRYVASSETSRRGRGRGRGRFSHGGRSFGRGFGRSARGRGRSFYTSYTSNNRDNIPESINVEGKTLYPRQVYKRTEYDQLTPGQRSALREARSKNSAIVSSDSSTIDTRSIASALSRDLRGMMINNSEDCY